METTSPVEPTSPTDPDAISDRQQFADELNRIRERAGLTVRDVARATGIPHSTAGGYLSGRHLPPVSQPEVLPNILHACGVDDADTVERWSQALARLRRPSGPRPADATTPYRGLSSFQPEDAEWFFGRHHLTRTLVERVAERWAGGGGPVALVGPSGSGKSSLLRAGVIPALRDGALADGDSASWPVLLFNPGAQPLAALAMQLSAITGGDADATTGELRADPALGAHIARRAAEAAHTGAVGGVVIVVDQFEEVFTECTDEDERQKFLAALHAAATGAPAADHAGHRRPPAAVLLGLRADFYHRALREHQLVGVLQQAQVAMGPMNQAELREAIIAPARKAGLEVEDGLVEVLLRDLAPTTNGGDSQAAHEAGALPLLSHALRATWERGTRWRLTVADYEAVGGVRGAVARTADAVYDSLTAAEQELARKLFVRLVRVGEDTPNTRYRAPRHELEALAGTHGRDALTEVLNRFVEERLITVDADTVEITHEALVAAWPRLRGWIEADRRGLLIAQRLDDDARQWRRDGRDPAMLYQGARLAAVQEWTETRGHRELTAIGREFLQASIHRERRRVRLLYQTITALTALLLLAVGSGAYAVVQHREAVTQHAAAEEERNLALSRMVAVRADRLRGSDPALAGQLALAAYRIAPTSEARSSLLSVSAAPAVTRMLGPQAIMQDISFHAGRNLLVAASDDTASVLVWDVSDRQRPQLLASQLPDLEGVVVNSVALSPDGRVLVAAGNDGDVYRFSMREPAAPVDIGMLAGPDSTITTIAFSPDGRTLAAGTQDGAVHLWDVSTPENVSRLGGPLTGPTDAVTSVAFSPDGRTLAAGSTDAAVHRWSLLDRAHPVAIGEPLVGPDRTVQSVAFSPDGATLVAGSADESTYLWQVAHESPEPADVLTGPSGSGAVTSVTYSSDGRTIATGSGDGSARLWNVSDSQVTTALPHPGPVTALVFEPGGQGIYTASTDGAVRRWALPGPVMRSATGAVSDLVHHPSAPIMVAGSTDGHLYLWDVDDQQRPSSLSDPLASPDEENPLVGTVRISPDGNRLAAVDRAGTIWQWDISDPQRPTLLNRSLSGRTGPAATLAFSPDGTYLAAGGASGIVQVWDLSDLTQPTTIATVAEGRGDVHSVAFSPDGQILAAGGADRTVWLWDLSEPDRPTLLTDLTGGDKHVDAVTFSPDGDTLVVGGADESVRIFDVTDPQRPQEGPVLGGPSGSVLWVAFSPDGQRITGAARDHALWQWDLTDPGSPELHAVLTGPEGGVNVLAYRPDGQTLAAGSSDTTVRLFYTDPEQVAARVCATAGDPVTREEWGQYVPGPEYNPPCP